MDENKMIRRFLPVGQGAFYCEQFFLSSLNRKINVVYDCGSGNHGTPPEKLKNQIRTTFANDTIIDALFISHFDNDHINGINFLLTQYHVRKIFLPVIDGKTKETASINKICFRINARNSFVYDFISNTVDTVKAILDNKVAPESIELIYVSENGSEQKPLQQTHQCGNYFISEKTILSRTPIFLTEIVRSSINANVTLENLGDFQKWVYIPFNFKRDENLKKLIEKLNQENTKYANKNGIPLKEDLFNEQNIKKLLIYILTHDINKLGAKRHYNKKRDNDEWNHVCEMYCHLDREKVIDIYKNLPYSINQNSMTLYSGTGADTNLKQTIECPHCSNLGKSRYIDSAKCNCLDGTLCSIVPATVCGCLYTGDYNASSKEAYQDLLNAYSAYINSIGCFQLPHHGSKDSYNNKILKDINNAIFVASVGSTNGYHHPGSNVIMHLFSKGLWPFIVTEQLGSRMTLIVE